MNSSTKINVQAPSGKVDCVVLISHGLNNSDYILKEMAKIVDPLSCYLIFLSLSGNNLEDNLHPKSWKDLWISEMSAAMNVAKDLAHTHHVPMVFMGFSFSCIIFLQTFAVIKIPFDRVIFFSPPLKVLTRHQVITFLGRLGLRWIPSLNQSKYRTHSFLPVQLYRELFDLIKQYQKQDSLRLPKKVLIFTDPRDALISYKAIEEQAKEPSLLWKVIPLRTGENLGGHSTRHLIVLKEHVGIRINRLIQDMSKTFILKSRSAEFFLPMTSYEHFFWNESLEEYPISIFIQLHLNDGLNNDKFKLALRNAQIVHPLLRSRINGRDFHQRKNLRWIVLEEDYEPYIDWQKNETTLQWPNDKKEIDLIAEIGFRVFVRQDSESTKVNFQFHHACVDGFGAMAFIESVFQFYSYPELKAIVPEILNFKDRFANEYFSLTSFFSDMSLLCKFISFRAKPLAFASAATISRKYDLSNVAQLKINSEDFLNLKSYAQRLEVTINDLLLYSLVRFLELKNRSIKSETNLRVTIPMNLRKKNQNIQSACNITGMYFLDCAKGKISLKQVHSEIRAAKLYGKAGTFNRFMGLMGNLPYGIKLVSSASDNSDQCSTSTCLTNLGVIDHWLPSVPMIEVFGYAPIRPGTRITFCVTTRKNILSISALFDLKYFSANEVENFLEEWKNYLIFTLPTEENLA